MLSVKETGLAALGERSCRPRSESRAALRLAQDDAGALLARMGLGGRV